MPLQVVHAHQRQACTEGDALGGVQPDHQRPGQAGAARGGDGVDIFQGQMGFGKGFFDDRQDGQDMLAAGHFRVNAAVAGVDVHLRGDGRSQQDAPVFEHGRGRLIAGGFDGEDAGRRKGSHLWSVTCIYLSAT